MGRQRQSIVPLKDSVVGSLQAGDEVQFSGSIYAARGRTRQRLCGEVMAESDLTCDLNDAEKGIMAV